MRRLRRPVVSSLAALLALVAVGCAGAEEGGSPPLRVLFLGNSLTSANDLPARVADLADAAGRRPLETRTIAPGGVSLEEHWGSTGAREALAAGPWDVVVLQQGPSSLPESRAHLRRWARRWADEARSRGARPALFATWPESERSRALPASIASYAAAAAASRSTLLPVGAAWRDAWRRDPDLPLYGPDGFHPSELGTLLAALVVYAGLTGASPSSLPVDDADEGTARVLREAAVEALADVQPRG